MNARTFACAAVGFAALVSSPGCASIISGRHADVTINSNPSNAHVTVHDKRGQEVASGTTPAKLSLKRNERYIFPAHYTATIEAPGYQSVDVPINSTINPWILGNIVVGGVPGLIVDNATGAAWKPKQSDIYQPLAPVYAAQPLPQTVPTVAAYAALPTSSNVGAPVAAGGPAQCAVYPATQTPAASTAPVAPSYPAQASRVDPTARTY